ncbi:MAG: hypothetical protein U1F16_02075 [Turneriella sp.]
MVKDRNEIVAEIRKPATQAQENLYIQEAILKGAIIPEAAKKTNIDAIVKKYSQHKLTDIHPQEIYESLKDRPMLAYFETSILLSLHHPRRTA